MDSKILEFLSKDNARIDNSGKWLVVSNEDGQYMIDVYEHTHRTVVQLYRGIDIEKALNVLGCK